MRKLSRTSITLTALTSTLVLAAAAATTTASATTTSPPSSQRTLATGVGGPFQIARRHGTVFYTDGFAGTLNKITRRGPRVVSHVTDIARRHHRPMVVHVGQYEFGVNPDRNVTYGVVAHSNTCANTYLKNATHTPSATYPGQKDSHPYQLAALPHGAWAVAEAAGNAILRVGRGGRISTIALLPPQRHTFTQAEATAMGAPNCIVGVTYAFEPVPTDVERGGNGSLWVSTLPGGPEDPSLGARGSVYRISRHGVVQRMATGFLGATNLAVARGRVYVAELFAGKITKIGLGGRTTALNIANPVSVEATRTKLFIGTLGTGPSSPGRIVRVPR
jgi:hypothetical protein